MISALYRTMRLQSTLQKINNIYAWTIIVVLSTSGAACKSVIKSDQAGELVGLDGGLQNQFVLLTLSSGDEVTGEVVGVYNEANFMWNPTIHSSLSVFTCTDLNASLESFSTTPGANPSIFSMSSRDFVSINIIPQPIDYIEYTDFMRANDLSFLNSPVAGEGWISTGWDTYHAWEDGRGNYAWDIGALNSNTMSYTGLGERNNQYAIWDVNVLLPMAGTVVTRVEKEIDNLPDITAAIDMGDHQDGSDVELEEKPQNLVEIKPIQGLESPFLLRLIHLRQNTIPDNIKIGGEYAAGTFVGTVGNSGTTLVPHLHVVWGFTDKNNRFWSLPIEWKNYNHRILMAYPTGYEYGTSHHHSYGFPKKGDCISNYNHRILMAYPT